ncbi:hypothetical protein JOY44_22015 [Phormidium sp. CLA17]|uniref:hypothetical protein n=1 Tax=Leptolyngbya sp. Cla-17 TaxID=2803751 RepID=UPI001490CC51|nr:hypothetical protein [Leptolyngbya sp. Cla-17]MBM0744258.1 hypothetical protein [Leptolyngbya sp. Cla-17]
MDSNTRQAKLRQKLRQLKQQHDTQFAKQMIEQLGISGDLVTWLVPDDQQASDCGEWLKRSFPWQWSQIDWANVPGSICYQCQKEPQTVAAFEQLCQQFQLGNPMVTVIWFNARNPILQMQLSTVQQNALALFNHDWDTWIGSLQAGWCIEYHHEETLCFGFGTISDGVA